MPEMINPYLIPMGYRSSAATGVRYTPSTDYNVNPGPQAGQGPYGTVPGAIGIPPDYWTQMQSIYPVAPQAQQASRIIGSQMAGELSPEEIATYQRLGAQFGAGITGGPTQFSGRQGLLSVGRKVSDVQQQGILNYEAMLKALSGTLTPQELAAQIASRNATMAAAPDPQQAAEQQMRDWMEKFQMAMNASAAQQRNYSLPPTINPYPGRPTTPSGPSWRDQYSADLDRALADAYRRPSGVPDRTPFAPPWFGTTYVDSNGVKWTFDSTTGRWRNGSGQSMSNDELMGGGFSDTGRPGAGDTNIDFLIDEAGIDQMMYELGYDPYGYEYDVDLPPGAYPQETQNFNISYTQPDDWWVQGYESPEDYDVAQYPGWYEDVGYFDDFGY